MEKIFQATNCLSPEDMQQYREGTLSNAQRFKVENHLLDCPLCSDAMEGFQGTDSESDHLIQEIYQAIDEKTVGAEIPRIKRYVPWNRIAAAVLLLITAGAAWIYYQGTLDAKDYLAYFEDQQGMATVRGMDRSALKEDLIAGVSLYEQKNFQGSLSFFQDYLEQQPESSTATYYAGLAAMQSGESGLAFDYLTRVRMNDDRLYEEATWYLTKIQLERGETASAKMLLEDLVKIDNGYFTDQAQILLQELK